MDRIISKNTNEEVFHPFRNDLKGAVSTSFDCRHPEIIKKKISEFSAGFEVCGILNNGLPSLHNFTPFIAVLGSKDSLLLNNTDHAFSKMKDFVEEHKGDWIFAALSYDLKNDVEDLDSLNEDSIDLPLLHLFVPEIFIYIEGNRVHFVGSPDPESLWDEIQGIEIGKPKVVGLSESDFRANPPKERYIRHVNQLLEEIKQGNIYEVNYCRELLAELPMHPGKTLNQLMEVNPAPFAAYYKNGDQHLICASPERFLLKNGSLLLSQPIKGTRMRSLDEAEDERLKKELFHDVKERAENVMIVDLTRNDLSKSAHSNSVKVSELFGIYTFPSVHQMISTIESRLKEDIHFMDALKECFPMGSMTGAPKFRAMKLIEEHEFFKRGMFSGSVGLISPSQNFDFNVVIRSILYNGESQMVSIKTGSAITALCNAENEWDECVLKARALLKSIVKSEDDSQL